MGWSRNSNLLKMNFTKIQSFISKIFIKNASWITINPATEEKQDSLSALVYEMRGYTSNLELLLNLLIRPASQNSSGQLRVTIESLNANQTLGTVGAISWYQWWQSTQDVWNSTSRISWMQNVWNII